MVFDFYLDRATSDQIASHLQTCDSHFIPPISERVNLIDYAKRIAANAHRFEAWIGCQFAGLVAVYCNDPERRRAFITSVSVLPGFEGRGIAGELLSKALEYVRNEGFRRIELEVDSKNSRAISLYVKHHFVRGEFSNSAVRMYLEFD